MIVYRNSGQFFYTETQQDSLHGLYSVGLEFSAAGC